MIEEKEEMMKKIIFFSVFLSLSLYNLFAQLLPIRNYSSQDGLSQNQVTNIQQDKKGYLWFLTNAGVSKFDGYHFQNFNLANGLSSNSMKLFFELKDYAVFLGADTFTIFKNNNLYINFNQQYLSKILKERVNSVNYYEDSDKQIYVFVATNSRIYYYDIEKNHFKLFIKLTNIPDKSDNYTPYFSIPDFNHVFIHYENNAYLINMKKKTIINISKKLKLNLINGDAISLRPFSDTDVNAEEYYIAYTDKIKNTDTWYHYKENNNKYNTIISSRKILSVYTINAQSENIQYVDKNGSKCYITDKGRFFFYNVKNRKGYYNNEIIKSNTIDLTQISDAYIIDNKIWISSYQGLLEFDRLTGSINTYTSNNGLSNNNIQIMFVDKEKNIWLGTNGTGVDMIVPGNITNYTEKNGLSHAGSSNTVEGNDGSIWVSTDNGITRILANGKYQYYSTGQGLPNNDVWALAKDKKGNIWAGTLNNGIVMFNGHSFINKRPKELSPSELYTTEIFVDSQGNIWIPGTYSIIRYDEKNNCKVYPNPLFSAVYQVIEDEQGLLWFASSKGGIGVFDKNGRMLKHYPIASNVFNSNIIGLEIINKNIIWCYTYGEGIIEFNRTTQEFKKLFTRELSGFEINKAYVRDNSGNLWLSTINGIVKIDKNKKIQIYTKEDGLVGNDARTTGAYKDSKGILWINTSFGVVRINPNNKYLDKIPPTTIITEFTMNGEIQDLEESHKFKHYQNTVNFKFVGLDFRNPNRVQYQYYLKNFDKEWSALLYEKSVRYTNLNPGRYKFQIRTVDHSGNISEVASVSFTIMSPFWETWWFRIFALVIMGFSIWLVLQWRLNILKRKNEELEHLVAVRTKQLREKNEQMISSIRYAERIQKALLPSEDYLKGIFNDIFVIFMPKDIISGDFYWFFETREHYYLGIIDCTGHGVPGALLSIVGDMLLNEIMSSNNDPEPAYILEQLHENVRSVLCQKKENNHSRDGMEVALCKMDKQFQELTFAGANRPLYLIKDGEENPLEIIRPTRKGIGGKQREEKRVFNNFKVNLADYTSLFILSDGFVDQNNVNNKKFGSKLLKELIVTNRNESAENQKKILLDNLTKYKQNEIQRDDITLIGVHFFKGKE